MINQEQFYLRGGGAVLPRLINLQLILKMDDDIVDGILIIYSSSSIL